MITVSYSKRFTRLLKKRISSKKSIEDIFLQKVEIFVHNPFHSSLKTHKLSGHLEGYWSFSVEYDLRIIFYFNSDNDAVFADIGTHDEVYWSCFVILYSKFRFAMAWLAAFSAALWLPLFIILAAIRSCFLSSLIFGSLSSQSLFFFPWRRFVTIIKEICSSGKEWLEAMYLLVQLLW